MITWSDAASTPPPLRWSGSLGIVLLVHALAIGAAVWLSRQSPPAPADSPMEAVMVELAPEPVAPATPPMEVPPGPPQQQQQRQAPAPRPSPPERTAEVFETVPPPSPATPADAAETDVEQTAAPPATTAQTHAPAAAQSVSGHSTAAEASWQDKLLGHLQRHRRYPSQAQWKRQEGVVYVQFVVDRQGRVSAIALGRSSGSPALDEEALATVKRASPVPLPPEDIEKVPFKVMVPVSFYLRR